MTAAAVRANAAQILASLLAGQGSLATALTSVEAEGHSLALLKELCFGSCRWYHQLNAELTQLLDKPMKNKDRDIHCLLIIGLHQLSRMRLGEHAAINETVNACLVLRKSWAKSLINGVLRTYQRNKNAGTTVAAQSSDDSVQYSHPGWLIQALQEAWPDDWRQVLEAGNHHPPMTLRVNQQATSRQAFLQALTDSGHAARAGELTPTAVYLSAPLAVTEIAGFNDGHVSVQDEASQLIPALLGTQAGHRVLDACAAPGGKTCHILEYQPEVAEVLALDIDERRLARLDDNLARLALTHGHVQRIAADAGELDAWWDGQPFDRVLLDAPCSATGIIRRQPDIKLLRTAADIDKLTALQARLLDRLWHTLKPGGLLMYSSCSILPAENSDQVEAFVQRTPDARHRIIEAGWGIACPYGRQLLPQTGSTDGFFYALIEKATA